MNKNSFLINKKCKKGALPILVFVILTFVVCTSTLFIFVTSPPEIEAVLENLNSLDKVHGQEAVARFYLKDSLETSFVKTYNDFVLNGDYLNNIKISNSQNFGEVYYIGDLSSNLESDFENRLKANFKESFLGFDFEKGYLSDLQKEIENENFEIVFNDNFAEVAIDSFTMNSKRKSIEVNYTPEIREKINITRFGLESFEDIVGFGKICFEFSNITEKENCYNENKDYLGNFGFDFSREDIGNQEELILEIESEKEFYFEESFDKIRFSFITE